MKASASYFNNLGNMTFDDMSFVCKTDIEFLPNSIPAVLKFLVIFYFSKTRMDNSAKYSTTIGRSSSSTNSSSFPRFFKKIVHSDSFDVTKVWLHIAEVGRWE